MIRIGIAGYGKIGKLRAEILKKRHDSKIIVVYDVKRPEDLDDGILFVDSYDKLLDHDIDAVFICAYNTVLAEFTIEALKKGMHVFCEKPPAMSTKELDEVVDVHKKTKMVLKYGFNHRYHYSVMECKKIIDSGTMGRLLWARGVYGKAGSIDYDKNWRNYKKHSGGGILIDQGIHMIDLIRFFSQTRFSKITSFIKTVYWNIEVEDNAFVLMHSDDNITASIHSSATQWRHKFLLELCFEEGFINLDGILSGTRSYAPEKMIVGRREFEDTTFAMGKPKESVTWYENDHSWNLEIDEFINAINDNSEIVHGTLNDAYETLKLIERIYSSNQVDGVNKKSINNLK